MTQKEIHEDSSAIERLPQFIGPLLILLILAAYYVLLGVSNSDVIKFLGYEVSFTLLPGFLLYRILFPGIRDRLRHLAIGWPLGYALAILTYLVLSASGLRSFYRFYPVIILIILIPVFLKRRPRPSTKYDAVACSSNWTTWIIILLISIFAMSLVTISPLGSTNYLLPGEGLTLCWHDLTFHLGVIAQLKNTWPSQVPSCSGQAFSYHYFVHAHIAAISYVTGVEISTVLLRLYALPMICLIVIQLFTLGYKLTRSLWGGGLVGLLVFAVREVEYPSVRSLFGNWAFLANMVVSPPFLLGIIFCLPLALEIGSFLAEHPFASESSGVASLRRNPRIAELRAARLITIFLLSAGAAGAQAGVLPMVLSALIGYSALELILKRRINWHGLMVVGVCSLAFLPVYYLLLHNLISSSLFIQPFHVLKTYSLAWNKGLSIMRLWKLSSPVSAMFQVLLGAGVVAGFLGAVSLGVVIRLFLTRERLLIIERWLLLFGGAGLTASLLLAQLGSSEVYLLFYALILLSPVAGSGFFRFFKEKRIGLFWQVIRIGCAIIIGALVFTTAVQLYSPTYNKHLSFCRRLTESNDQPGYSLYEGLRWIRNNTARDAVLANNYWERLFFCYSAYSERRIVFESWGYNPLSHRAKIIGLPNTLSLYHDRTSVLDRIFREGDPLAIREVAERFGATHLLVDKLHGSSVSLPAGYVSKVYSNPEIEVYEICGKDEHTKDHSASTLLGKGGNPVF